VICPEWLDSFENFYADMGPCPLGMTLERSDNDKGYSKDNCVWATRETQATNMQRQRKITAEDAADIRRLVAGESGPYTRIGAMYGISASLVCRIVKGQAWKT
jgi:DNA invertase Pin-like site-specific DNA recombinase